jgi:hypothetical protein
MKYSFILSNLGNTCPYLLPNTAVLSTGSFAYDKVADVMGKAVGAREGRTIFLNFIFQMEARVFEFFLYNIEMYY